MTIGAAWAERWRWTVERNPDKPAVIDLSVPFGVLTYGELARLADQTARQLRMGGVGEGTVVAYQLPNWWEFAVLTLALWCIDALPAPILPGLDVREVERILNLADAALWITPKRFRGRDWTAMFATVSERIPHLRGVKMLDHIDPARRADGLWAPETGHLSKSLPIHWGSATRPAQLLFTSGTTGEPKGVLHTHESLGRALERHTEQFPLTSADVIFVPSPMAHQTGFLYGMLLAWHLGASAVYLDHWHPETASAAIRRHGVTFVQAALPFLVDLARLEVPPRVPLFVATGSSVPGTLLSEMAPRLSGRVVKAWGSTETGLATSGRLQDLVARGWTSDGGPMPGAFIRVQDSQNRPLAAGEVGKLWVKTDSMFSTYWKHPEWRRQAVNAEGFFDTGDLATRDEEGYIAIAGREKDVVNRGGEKIPVGDLEALLYQCPGVADVAVVAMPDARLGERACAVVVPYPHVGDLTLNVLTDFLAGKRLSKVYWPERLELVDELPRTASGKVQKFKLRQLVRDRLQIDVGNFI